MRQRHEDVGGLVRRRIRAMRQTLGWSQSEMARRMTAADRPMHQTTVAKLESGTRPLTIDELAVIAKVLETTVPTLVEPESEYDDLMQRLGQAKQEWEEAMRQTQLAQRDLGNRSNELEEKRRVYEVLLNEAERRFDGQPGETT